MCNICRHDLIQFNVEVIVNYSSNLRWKKSDNCVKLIQFSFRWEGGNRGSQWLVSFFCVTWSSGWHCQGVITSDCIYRNIDFNTFVGGPGTSVGIATGYGLDGPGIESRWGRDFPHQSRPALGPTQPSVQWVPDLSRGKERPGRGAEPSPPSSAVVMKE